MTKDFIRHSILSARQNVEVSLLKEMSDKICYRFYETFCCCGSFLMYWPIKSEVDILPLIEKLHKEGKSVYLPSVEGGSLHFKKFEGVSKMVCGSFGIPESIGKPLDSAFEVLVVPAVAYDFSCYRLGYGKGFYDRFIAHGYPCIKVGVAYDFQIVDTVYPESHDEPVDIIFSEKRIIRRI